MPSEIKQFCELPDRIPIFGSCFRSALTTLVQDLAQMPCYVRERQVVNLFVLHHLIPAFQSHDPALETRQIAIEVPVWINPKPEGKRPVCGVYADIVVWPHTNATNWHTCRPLDRIEWKNISCIEDDPAGLEREHKDDIRELLRNREWSCLNYAVISRRRNQMVGLSCKKIEEGEVRSLRRTFGSLRKFLAVGTRIFCTEAFSTSS